MNSVQISSDGQTATIGGGVIAKEVTDALWAAKKQTGSQITMRVLEILRQLTRDSYWCLRMYGFCGPYVRWRSWLPSRVCRVHFRSKHFPFRTTLGMHNMFGSKRLLTYILVFSTLGLFPSRINADSEIIVVAMV